MDRLLTILGINHLSYTLINASISIDNNHYTTFLTASSNFKEPFESKISLDNFFKFEMTANETPLDICIRYGFANYIWEMLVVDFLILNRDRHGTNIEVLKNNKTKIIRLDPLFYHGLSLVFNCLTEYDLEAMVNL